MTDFAAQRVIRSSTLQLPSPRSSAFSLFEPLGEKRWAHEWEPEILYPSSGIAEVGTVFMTRHPHEPAKVWTITAHDVDEAHLTYFNVLPGSHVTTIDIQCDDDASARTVVHVTYTLTALSPDGNIHLQHFTEDYYHEMMESWQTAIVNYLLHS
ncbi:MAG: hypothetical protein U0694_18090 [Anaerolineae bacterium]